MNKATIAHELVHTLGFDHEQNRPDRDDWVVIDFNNVIDRIFNSDFRILDQTQFQDFSPHITTNQLCTIIRLHMQLISHYQPLKRLKAHLIL